MGNQSYSTPKLRPQVLEELHEGHLGVVKMKANGPQFKSEEFQMFLKRNRIKHLTSAPYHPASNGLAEPCVKSFKSAMKSETEVKPLNIKLAT